MRFIVSVLGCYCLLGSYGGKSEWFLLNSSIFAIALPVVAGCVKALDLVAMLWPSNCRNLRNVYTLNCCVSVCNRLNNIQTFGCFDPSK